MPELRGKLCRAAFETVQEMMAVAAIGGGGFRTGMVAFTATAGDLLNSNPHVHAIAPRGGWDNGGSWVPVAFVDNDAAERLFRAKVISILTGEGLLSDERAQDLMSWNHNSGFSVDDSVHLVRYLGHYSNVARGRRKKGKEHPLTPGRPRGHEGDGLTDAERRARRRKWARLIRRVYEVDPLVCPSCGGEMRIISVILEHRVLTRILGHLARKGITPGRDPPGAIRAS